MAEITRWRGANLIDDARREMEDVFRRVFGQGDGEKGESRMAWSPRVDLTESENAVVVKADIPGVDPKNVEITVNQGVLTVRGEKKEEREEKKKNFHKMERFIGTFQRDIPLPTGIDEEKVTATASNGTIVISLPKKPGSTPKKIELKAGGA